MRISLIRIKLINRSAEFWSFCIVGFGLSVFCVASPIGRAAEAFDFQLAGISDKITEAVSKANIKTVTVAGFTDLHDNDFDLGLFLADQLSAALVQKNCVVVDRRNVAKILAEHKLTTSGLVDPETTKKLGLFAGVDAIVIGTVTPLSQTVRLTVEVLATDSAKVLAAASGDIPITNSIRRLLGENEIPEPTPTPPVWKDEIVQPPPPTFDSAPTVAAIAEFDRGRALSKGDGVAKDLVEAARCFRHAADLGYAPAQFQLGVAYAKGWGVPRSDTEAVSWYRKAAEQGYAEAQHDLGVRCILGQGTKLNIAEGIDWYRKSAAQGWQESSKDLRDRGL
jgi:hypothetical protein